MKKPALGVDKPLTVARTPSKRHQIKTVAPADRYNPGQCTTTIEGPNQIVRDGSETGIAPDTNHVQYR